MLGVIKQFRAPFLSLPILTIVSGYVLTKNFNLIQLFWASLSYLFIHFFVVSVNNTYDVPFDTVSKIMSNQNPIVTGELTLQEARMINYITPVLAIMTSFFVGYYWTILILIGLGLVILYDLKPFRLKDRPSGILIVPLYQALPFLFVYMNTTSNLVFPPSVLFSFIFLFLSQITSLRHIPDFEKDVQMNVHNFTSRYSIKATTDLMLLISMILPVVLTVAIILNYLSIFGLPLLVLVTILKISLLLKPINYLKTPQAWGKYVKYMIMDDLVLLTSIAGIYIR